MLKKENPKVAVGAKLKLRCFQQSTSTRKSALKAPKSRPEDKVFDLSRQRNAAEYVKNYEALSKFIAVKYRHSNPKMTMITNNVDKPMIVMTKIPEDTASRVEIFIW